MKSLTKIALLMATAICGLSVQAAPISNLVANWHMDEGRGQKVIDLSGFARNGQLGSAPALDANDPIWVARRFDTTALRFAGNNFVKVNTAGNLEPQRISVEAWVKADITDPTALPYIVAKSGMDCQFAAYGLYLHEDANHPNGGVPYFYVVNADGTGYNESPVGAESIVDGKWHHIVGTYDQRAVRMYVDGVQIGAGTPATSAIGYSAFTNKDLYIGDYDGNSNICNSYNGNFIGDIDEVRIWNRALTATEVASRVKGY